MTYIAESHAVGEMRPQNPIVPSRTRAPRSMHGATDNWVSAYRHRAIAAGPWSSRWFPGTSPGGKRERGPSSTRIDASRGCPRNCERIAASTTATGKLGRPDAKQQPASQETCQRRHPTDGRGAPYGADFRSGDSGTDARTAAMVLRADWLIETTGLSLPRQAPALVLAHVPASSASSQSSTTNREGMQP